MEALAPLLLLLVIGAALASFKIGYVGLTPNADYASYLSTAALFRGVPGAAISPPRILKPLNPLLVAGEERFLSPEVAFMAQSVFFYFLLLLACYALGRAFGFRRSESFITALLLGASYPVLKYGVDLYTETGALFFYVSSLILTLYYLRVPSWRIVLANAAVLTLGFLWKEYSIVSAAIFGLAILFHPRRSRREKIEDLGLFAGLFLAVNLALGGVRLPCLSLTPTSPGTSTARAAASTPRRRLR